VNSRCSWLIVIHKTATNIGIQFQYETSVWWMKMKCSIKKHETTHRSIRILKCICNKLQAPFVNTKYCKWQWYGLVVWSMAAVNLVFRKTEYDWAESDLRSSRRVEEAIHIVSFLLAVASHGRWKQWAIWAFMQIAVGFVMVSYTLG